MTDTVSARAKLDLTKAPDQTIANSWLKRRDELIAAAPDAQRTKIRTQLSVANIARLHVDN